MTNEEYLKLCSDKEKLEPQFGIPPLKAIYEAWNKLSDEEKKARELAFPMPPDCCNGKSMDASDFELTDETKEKYLKLLDIKLLPAQQKIIDDMLKGSTGWPGPSKSMDGLTEPEVTTLSRNDIAFWSGALPGLAIKCVIESNTVLEKAWNDLYDRAQSDEMVDTPTIVKAKDGN
jgi:hypothetical protein